MTAGTPLFLSDMSIRSMYVSTTGLFFQMPDPVIPTSMGAIELAREVINANPRTNQVEQMKAIMECLATKHDGLSSGDAMDVLSDEASMLEELIQ